MIDKTVKYRHGYGVKIRVRVKVMVSVRVYCSSMVLFPVFYSFTHFTSSNSALYPYTLKFRHSSTSLFIALTSFSEAIVELNIKLFLTASSAISHITFKANRCKKVKYSNYACKQNNHTKSTL